MGSLTLEKTREQPDIALKLALLRGHDLQRSLPKPKSFNESMLVLSKYFCIAVCHEKCSGAYKAA